MKKAQAIEKVRHIVEELEELLDRLDTVSVDTYLNAEDKGAKILDTAFVKIRAQKEELEYYIDEAKKGVL